MTAAGPRVPCPLRGGASVDLEKCVSCSHFKGSTACGTDPHGLVYAGANWWRLLIP